MSLMEPEDEKDGKSESLNDDVTTPSPLDQMIDGLVHKCSTFSARVMLIRHLHQNNEFKLLSKKSRNNLILGLLDEMGDLEELTKLTFKSLKKVKRERVPEDKIDAMLGIPDHIRNAVRGEEEPEESDGQ